MRGLHRLPHESDFIPPPLFCSVLCRDWLFFLSCLMTLPCNPPFLFLSPARERKLFRMSRSPLDAALCVRSMAFFPFAFVQPFWNLRSLPGRSLFVMQKGLPLNDGGPLTSCMVGFCGMLALHAEINSLAVLSLSLLSNDPFLLDTAFAGRPASESFPAFHVWILPFFPKLSPICPLHLNGDLERFNLCVSRGRTACLFPWRIILSLTIQTLGVPILGYTNLSPFSGIHQPPPPLSLSSRSRGFIFSNTKEPCI